MDLTSTQEFNNAPIRLSGAPATGISDYFGSLGYLPKLIKNATPSPSDDAGTVAPMAGSVLTPLWWLGIIILVIGIRLAYEMS